MLFSKPRSQKSIAWLFFIMLNAEFALQPLVVIASAGKHSGHFRFSNNAPGLLEMDRMLGKPNFSGSYSSPATKRSPEKMQVTESAPFNGPIQPEMKAFSSVNSSNMVDLFTGDFSYNIPLLDVGGYPVNLSYRAGITMDQEASWVGLGWNVNPGTVNRNVRGLPDDFNGKNDFITKTISIKENKTIGVTAGADIELVGLPLEPGKRDSAGLKIGVQGGLFYNTYKGWGMEKGLNASLNSGKWANGQLTAGLSVTNNSQEGLSISPSLSSRLFKYKNEEDGGVGTLTISSSYNSRSGIKGLQLGIGTTAYKQEGANQSKSYSSSFNTSLISFASPTFTPTISMPFTSRQYSFTGKVGFEQVTLHPSFFVSGYVTSQKIDDEDKTRIMPAYGYLHFQDGARNRGGLMDYNREKDLPYREKPATPHLAVPFYTYDAFSITGEGTGGMFRAYRGDIGFVSDHIMRTKDASTRASVDIGVGNILHAGVDLNINRAFTQSGPWVENNLAGQLIDFKRSDGAFEAAYFRNPGEKAIHPASYYQTLGGDDVVAFALQQQNSSRSTILASNFLRRYKNKKAVEDIQLNEHNVLKTERAKRTQVITSLNALEASEAGLEKFILSYPLNNFDANSCAVPVFTESLTNGLRAEYFAKKDFTGSPIVRTDAAIDFNFFRNPPISSSGFPGDFFSIRWTGRVRAPETGRYIFRTRTDDGVRLWINDSLVINDWTIHAAKDVNDTLQLIAGELYTLKMEYFDEKKDASVRLSWQRPSSSTFEVIPAAQFFLPEQLINNVGGVEIEKRVGNFRKENHLSEINVLNADGRRYVYGIPVYNFRQKEVTFSVNRQLINLQTGMAGYSSTDNSVDNNQGKDAYYNAEETPAHAQSFLLTGILSSDYVDLSGNGISDDDLGDAVRFNYTRVNNSSNSFKWRAPWTKDSVNLAEGLKTETRDDKGTYVYGERESWYLHTIESKTMIATFILEGRADGKGVGENGGLTNTSDGKRLREIRLYSKAAFRKSPTDAVPVKVVHFEYSYELCKGIYGMISPGDTTGKLTLKKVWFTYNGNNKGQKNPYLFHYSSVNPGFKPSRYTDRWGTYKDPGQNPTSGGVIQNDDYPYALQDSTVAAANSSAWNLDSISLPSGGSMKIQYESDDYGYVQSKRAMQFFKLAGMGSSPQMPVQPASTLFSGGNDFRYAYIRLTEKVSSKEDAFRKYLSEVKKLYFRMSVKMPDDKFGTGYEYVPCYADLETPGSFGLVNDSVLWIKMEGINIGGDGLGTFSPLAKAAIQFLRLNLPSKAYPGSEAADRLTAENAIQMLLANGNNILEALLGFDRLARLRGWCSQLDLNKTLIRLQNPMLKKIGGGHRVKKVLVYDNWDKMTGQRAAVYGQEYIYRDEYMMGADSVLISSGVAAYEPGIGGEENPFHVPIEYVEKIAPLGPVTLGYSEEPLGESLFPSPDIGYSVVRVKNVHYKNAKSASGFTETRFFTAKDFPVLTDRTVIDSDTKKRYKPAIAAFLRINAKHYVGVSQGFKIELNDMHGKMRSQASYSQNDLRTPVTRTDYVYKSEAAGSGARKLTNTVMTADKAGRIDSAAIVGKEIELMVDMREQYSVTNGYNVNLNTDMFSIPFVPPFMLIPSFIGLAQREETRFRAVAATKMIHRYGILDSVVQFDKGSKISTRELVYDKETGDPLLTRTQNEFNDYVYNLNYPAHWHYDGMGHAYRNIDAVFEKVTIRNGKLAGSLNGRDSLLVSGDELLVAGRQRTGEGAPGCADDISSFPLYNKIWVVDSGAVNGGTRSLYFIDQWGVPYNGYEVTLKIIRSGRRNMGGAVGGVTMLESPVVKQDGNYKLLVDSGKGVLNAGAMAFREKWNVNDVKRRVVIPATCLSEYSGLFTFSSGGTDVLNDMYLLGDSAIILAGSTTGYGASGTDAYLVKLNSQHNVEWARTYGGAQNDQIAKVVPMGDSGYVVIGSTSSYGDLPGNIFVSKLNSNGTVDWSRRLNMFSDGIPDVGMDILVTTEGDIVFSGISRLAGGTADLIVGSYTAIGGVNWLHRTGDSISDPIAKLVERGDSIIVAGSVSNNTDYQLAIISISKSTGVFTSNFYYNLGGRSSWVMQPFVTDDGLRIGSSNSLDFAGNSFKVTITDLDTTGWVIRSRIFSSPGNQQLRVCYASPTSDKGMIVTQTSADSGYLVIQKVDSVLNLQWSNQITIQGNKSLSVIKQKHDGSYTGAGLLNNQFMLMHFSNQGLAGCGDSAVTMLIEEETVERNAYNATDFDVSQSNPTISLNPVLRAPLKDTVACNKQVPCFTSSACISLITDTTLNPYTTGLLGNWRMNRSYVYYNNRREQDPALASNTRTNGVIANFEPYWTFSEAGIVSSADTNKWVWNAQSTRFNAKGLEVENSDPLGRYNAGLYGYNHSLPTAVVQNAKLKESAFEGFEDYNFGAGICDTSCSSDRHLDFGVYKSWISDSVSHTGTSSLEVPEGETAGISVRLSDYFSDTSVGGIAFETLYDPCVTGHALSGVHTDSSMLLSGFQPAKGKRMVLSAWVKETTTSFHTSYTDNKIVVDFPGTGTSFMFSPSGAIVEGWQRYEAIVDIPSNAELITIGFQNNADAAVYFDDFRIHPYHANMKSFVYHPENLRLMAELDENNYATLYEYDDDGTLIRVKKETQRGVMTIKETRSALIKD